MLTVLRLNMPPTLARTFRSTNAIESMISICRTHASNVKRWRDGTLALRWCAAMVEAGKQFRRVPTGCFHNTVNPGTRHGDRAGGQPSTAAAPPFTTTPRQLGQILYAR